MKQHVTVIASDRLILVDGSGMRIDFSTAPALHAIQWHNGKGHLEYTDGRLNAELTEDDYATEVAPYVALWEAENARPKTELESQSSLGEMRVE